MKLNSEIKDQDLIVSPDSGKHERQSKHSKKPEFFQDLIEKVSECPRLEMFARRQRKCWYVFGNEVSNSIELNAGNNYS